MAFLAPWEGMVRSLLSPAVVIERARSLSRPVIWGTAVYVSVVLFFAVAYLKSDSKQAFTLLAVSALGPLGIYGALRSPLIFPFCAYILFLPFESLSSLGSGGTLAKLLGVLTAGALLIRVVRRGCAIAPPGAVVAWAVLILWMGISMFWALDLRAAVGPFQMYASLVALFALLAIVRVTSTEFNCVLGAIVTAGVISAGYDAYLYHSGQSLISANAGVSRVMITVGDASIDPNSLAAALVLPTALALYLLFNSRYLLISIMMFPALAILLLGFAASGSRGGFVDLGVVFFYLIVRSRHRLWLGGLMVVAIVTTVLANPGLPARFVDAQQDGGAGRRDIWHVGLYAFRDYWLTGAGVGNFPNAFDREYLNVYAQYVLGWHWAAHNVPLMIATELGVIGFSIFVVAIIMQFRILQKLAVADARSFELRLVVEGAFLGTLVSGFSTSDLSAKYVWLSFSLMALYRGYLLSRATTRPFRAEPRRAPTRRPIATRIGA